MHIINIHEAKTHLSKLIDKAVKGETFIIAKAGKPLVKVTRLDLPAKIRRTDFMLGEINVPDDFDSMGSTDIDELFRGEK